MPDRASADFWPFLQDQRSAFALRDAAQPEQNHNAGLQMPTIFISGYDDKPSIVHAKSSGAVAFPTNPFDDPHGIGRSTFELKICALQMLFVQHHELLDQIAT